MEEMVAKNVVEEALQERLRQSAQMRSTTRMKSTTTHSLPSKASSS